MHEKLYSRKCVNQVGQKKKKKKVKPTDLWHQLKELVQLTNECDHISLCHISNSLLVKQAGQPLLSHSRVGS